MPKRINVDDSQRAPVQIGLNGENDAREIAYDITPWAELSGAANVMVKRAGDTNPYISAATVDGNNAIWAVSDADLLEGYGELQFVFTSGDTVIAKSPIFTTFVAESLSDDTVTPPDPIKSWYDDVIAAARTVGEAADRAESAAQQATEAAGSIGDAVERAEAAADEAEASAAGIGTAVEDAQNAADRAEAAVSGIEADAAAATAAAAAAAESQTAAAQSASSANAGRLAAETAAQNAQQSASQAAESVASIGDSVERAESAASRAESASGTATTAAQTATEKAEAASGYLDTVQADSQAAQQAATNAAASESAAAQSAQTAQTAATSTAGSVEAAAASAAAAATSAEQAAQSVASIGNSVEQAQAAASTATSKAGEASSSAEAAAESAQTAQAAASSVAELVPIPTAADNGKVMTVVDGKWTAVDPAVSSWEKVQLIVRAGLAPRYFPVGYEFTTHDSTNDTDIIWRVVGYDTIKAADEALTHSMVLETKCVYSNSTGSYISMQFDAPETLYYAETGLEAGTYNFTLLAGYYTNYGGGKTYSFILTKPVPAGGIIMFPWGYNQQASEVKISTYATQADTTAIETVPVTEGSEGTSLGTADGKTENMNHTHHIRYGSNNYAQSAIKQWLNSAEAVGSVWVPQTVFDRPPNWASNRTGFLAGLPEDFLSVVQAAIVTCRTNSIFEVDSLDGTEFTINQTYNLQDKFFLLSRPEIYGTWDSAEVKDGELLEYYSGLTDAERIKYDPAGSARYCWLRSPYPGGAYGARIVGTSGVVDGHAVVNAYAAAPACIIA